MELLENAKIKTPAIRRIIIARVGGNIISIFILFFN